MVDRLDSIAFRLADLINDVGNFLEYPYPLDEVRTNLKGAEHYLADALAVLQGGK